MNEYEKIQKAIKVFLDSRELYDSLVQQQAEAKTVMEKASKELARTIHATGGRPIIFHGKRFSAEPMRKPGEVAEFFLRMSLCDDRILD